jgi:hypothetical protein
VRKYLIGVALVFFLTAYFLMAPRDVKVQTTYPTRGNFVQTVTTTGVSQFNQRLENVTKIPTGALFKSEGRWAVYRVYQNKAQLIYVAVKAMNADEAVIDDDLGVTDTIIIYPGDLVRDGVQVKIEKK